MSVKKNNLLIVVIVVIVFYLITELLGFMNVFLNKEINLDTSVNTMLWKQSLLMFSQKLILFIIIFVFFKKTKIFFLKKVKISLKSILTFKIALAMLLGLGFIIIQEALYYLINHVIYGNEYLFFNYKTRTFEFWKIPLFFSTIIIVPITEELIFRKYIFTTLDKTYNVYALVLISSLLFSIVHLPNIHSTITALFGGIIISLLYVKFKRIIYPIVFHITWNAIVIALPYFN